MKKEIEEEKLLTIQRRAIKSIQKERVILEKMIDAEIREDDLSLAYLQEQYQPYYQKTNEEITNYLQSGGTFRDVLKLPFQTERDEKTFSKLLELLEIFFTPTLTSPNMALYYHSFVEEFNTILHSLQIEALKANPENKLLKVQAIITCVGSESLRREFAKEKENAEILRTPESFNPYTSKEVEQASICDILEDLRTIQLKQASFSFQISQGMKNQESILLSSQLNLMALCIQAQKYSSFYEPRPFHTTNQEFIEFLQNTSEKANQFIEKKELVVKKR